MFDWYWYFLFYAIMFHLGSVAFSLYVHRTIGHGHFVLSKPLEYLFRIILWTSGKLGPRWAQTYASRHRKHHVTSDTADDPHSPYCMSFKEMCQPWRVDSGDYKKYCADIKTPDDWMQKNLHEKYNFLGPWVLHAVSFILFGIVGGLLSILIKEITKPWLSVFIGNYATHKIGFSYAGHRSPNDQSKNLFPIGILLAGEELHNNHHNHPRSPNFSYRWFEFDLGYTYAKIFSVLGLLKINKVTNK